jgi:hypothetical protein
MPLGASPLSVESCHRFGSDLSRRSDFRAAAGIAQKDVVVQPAANHAPIRHARPIAESMDTRIACANVELATQVAAELVVGLERVHVRFDFKIASLGWIAWELLLYTVTEEYNRFVASTDRIPQSGPCLAKIREQV